MRRLPLVLVWCLVSGHAAADTDELCRPYARAATDLVIPFVWMRAWAHCVNADNVPAAPATPLEVLQLATPTLPPLPADPPAPAAVGKSGAAVGSPAWRAWCRRWYPLSFDAGNGTVIRPQDRRSHKRSRCPG